MTTILFASPLFQQHKTGPHPECAARLAALDRRFEQLNLTSKLAKGTIPQLDPKDLAITHTPELIAAAQAISQAGGGALDADTILSEASYRVALHAAGAAVAAVDEVMCGRHRNALCLLRPPGHHATRKRSMGFCIFNNIAIAAHHAQRLHGANRILIVDWDVHHGNGTQDIFYDTEEVVFFSIHRHPFYPGTGSAEETGASHGLGATINVPIAYGTSRNTYLSRFRSGLEQAAQRARPDLVLISAGFDAHKQDPIGDLGLETEDFATMTQNVQEVASHYCHGRIVSCLEGGYDLEALADSVAVHAQQLQSLS